MGMLDLLPSPGLSALALDRHDLGLNVERRSRPAFEYNVSLALGACGALSLTLDKKKVRKAVAAVMVSAMFAAMNCQYVSQTESIALTVRLVWIPKIRIMVHMIVRIVRQRQDDKAAF